MYKKFNTVSADFRSHYLYGVPKGISGARGDGIRLAVFVVIYTGPISDTTANRLLSHKGHVVCLENWKPAATINNPSTKLMVILVLSAL